MPNKCLQPRLRRKPMLLHRWLLPKLMANNEEPVAMRAGALLDGALLTVGSSIPLAPVRRPTTSSGPHRQTRRLNGMPPPARTDAATCASRTPTRCAGMGTKRHANKRRSLLILSPAPSGAFFAPLDMHRGGVFRSPVVGDALDAAVGGPGPCRDTSPMTGLLLSAACA